MDLQRISRCLGLWVMLSTLTNDVTGSPCAPCSCTKNKTVVFCNWKSLTDIPHNLPADAMELYFKGNCLKHINRKRMKYFRQLKVLDISENMHVNCPGSIRTLIIDSDAFRNTRKVEWLNLSRSLLNVLPKAVLRPLSILTHLDMSYNEVGMEAVIRSLKEVTSERLQTLDVSGVNRIDHFHKCLLNKTFYSIPALSSLTHLRVDNNNIWNITVGFGHYFSLLETVSLRGNKLIGNFAAVLDVASTKHLKSIDLSNQNEYHTAGDTSNNTIKQKVSLRIKVDPPPGCVYSLPTPPELTWLSVANYSVIGPIFDLPGQVCWNGTWKLKYLDASNLQLRKISHPKPFQGLVRLLFANFQGCGLKQIHHDLFITWRMLRTLLLGGNELGRELNGGGHHRLFQSQEVLESLDLSDNKVTILGDHIFRNLYNLQYLNLSGNSIRTFKHNVFEKLINLRHLDLSDNQMQILPKIILDWIDKKIMTTNLTLDLSDNHLSCKCKHIPFMQWMARNSRYLVNYENYTCWSFNDTEMILADIDINAYEEKCFVKDVQPLILIVTSILSMLVLLALAVSLAYRYRWKMRYLWYISCRFWRRYEELKEDTDYEYDAFVAYNKEDAEWVMENLLPNMEGVYGFKFCIHDRDFLAGDIIEETIVSSIDKSRKTILVLSPPFLESGWCHFEVQMARYQLFKVGKDVLVLVVLEDLSAAEVAKSKTLRTLMETKTYLKWTDEEEGKALFWKRLQLALHLPNQNTLLT